VKNASAYAKRLSQLLGKLRKAVVVKELPKRSPLEQLIYSFLEWNCTRKQADNAFKRLQLATVDLNDLRVSDPDELVEIIGRNYHLADQRMVHLKNALNSIYRLEHGMALESLAKLSKRDARAYLDKLDGMVPFVSASVVLNSLEGHAVPVDDELRKRLAADSVVSPYAGNDEVQSFIEHHVRADQAMETFQLLRAYVEGPIKITLTGPVPVPPKPEPVVVAPPPPPLPQITASRPAIPTGKPGHNGKPSKPGAITITAKKLTPKPAVVAPPPVKLAAKPLAKPIAKPAAKPAAKPSKRSKASRPAPKRSRKPAKKPASRRATHHH
jgi:endonuclease III